MKYLMRFSRLVSMILGPYLSSDVYLSFVVFYYAMFGCYETGGTEGQSG